MTIFSSAAPRPIFKTKASRDVAQIRVDAMKRVPLEYEPPRLTGWFRIPRSIRMLRHRLYLYMEEPTSSRAAWNLNIFLTICNVLSTVTYCLESFPTDAGDGVSVGVWYIWEVGLMIIFTIELICRAPAHTTVKQFVFRRPEIFIDFLACVPFDLYLLFGLHYSILDTRWLRPVRLLRIVKMGNHIIDLKLILFGLRRSVWMIGLVWFLAILGLFSFASLLFMAERGAWDASRKCYIGSNGLCADFDSVPTALYFSLEVTSSLGYGDIVPLTSMGKLITMLLMLVSVSILALTVTVFSVQFGRVYEGTHREILLESLREATDLTMRVSTFEAYDNKKQIRFNDAACRLVTSVEVLQAISNDLSETLKKVRADLVYLSECKHVHGVVKNNPILGRTAGALPKMVEITLAELGAAAYNDIDTLTSFALRTTEELFVNGVRSSS